MPDTTPDRPRSQWTEGVHSRLDLLCKAIEENTKATVAMSARINSIFLVPLALAAIGAATWALFEGKINEHSWLGVLFACMAEFFGKGVRNVIEGFLPWSKRGQEAKNAATVVCVLLGISFAVGGALTPEKTAYEPTEKIPVVDRSYVDRVDLPARHLYGL